MLYENGCELREKFLEYRTSGTQIIDFESLAKIQLTEKYGVEISVMASSIFDHREYISSSNWIVRSRIDNSCIFYGMEAARKLSIYIKEDFISEKYGEYANQYGISPQKARDIWQVQKSLLIGSNAHALSPEQTQALDDCLYEVLFKCRNFVALKDPERVLSIQEILNELNTKLHKANKQSANDLMICPLTRIQVMELALGNDQAKLYFD